MVRKICPDIIIIILLLNYRGLQFFVLILINVCESPVIEYK
jgi:hypothetical protein